MARRAAARTRRGGSSGSLAGRRLTPGADAPGAGLVWQALLLAVAGVLVYAGSLGAPFLFDDENAIVNNRTIRSLSPADGVLAPPADTPVAGRPVVNLTYAVNFALHGLDPRGYRAVNVAIHVLAALTVFGIVRRTLLLPALEARFGTAAAGIGLAAALLWLLHPLQTESVNYLSERTESLMGLFYLLTLYWSLRDRTALAVAACALGMACKESMVTAPVAVVLYDRIFRFDSLAAAFRARRGFYAGLAATWFVLGALMAAGTRTSIGFDAGVSPWVYLLNQAEIVARYLWLTVWPRALVLDYGLPRTVTMADVWLPGLLVLALVAVALTLLRVRPMLGFLCAWVFLTLAPTSTIVPIATEVGAERRMYLPLAGLAVLAAFGLFRLTRGRAFVAVTAVLCVLLAAGTVARNREYASRLTMAQTVVDRRPHGRGLFQFGTELLASGQQDAGLAALRRSAVEYDYPGARFALGTELLASQRFEEAAVELRAFIEVLPAHPSAAPARDMLGRALLAQEKFGEAADIYASLRETAPNYRGPNNDVLFNYGYALAASGRLREAMPVLEQAVAANPGDATAQDLLARIRKALTP